MLLHLAADGTPIYNQIADQIRYRIAAGQLRPGDDLPPIRSLAESLRVNLSVVPKD